MFMWIDPWVKNNQTDIYVSCKQDSDRQKIRLKSEHTQKTVEMNFWILNWTFRNGNGAEFVIRKKVITNLLHFTCPYYSYCNQSIVLVSSCNILTLPHSFARSLSTSNGETVFGGSYSF